ncbi:MAG: hypothetical protein IPP88_22230 [Betaproteobacteria bacterium]|nr:hypothetical protein [Betaproteobacteria bacterium]
MTIVTAGTCIIAADQAGNTTYAAASQVPQSIVINKGQPGRADRHLPRC